MPCSSTATATERVTDPDAPRELLTTVQVVRITGLARNTVLDAAAAGRIPAYKLLGVWRYPSDLLAAWMEARFNQPQVAEPAPSGCLSRPAADPDHRQRAGAAHPGASNPLPLPVLFPHAAHRGIFDELPLKTAHRPTGRRRARAQTRVSRGG